MAQHLLAKGQYEPLKAHLDLMATAAQARKADADARASEAKASAGHSDTHAKLIDALSGHHQAQTDRAIAQTDHVAKMGALANDTLATHAGATRDYAAAHRDRVGAVSDALQPVQTDENLNAPPAKASA